MVKGITGENFKRFGWVIEIPRQHLKKNGKNIFRIVCSDKKAPGWRIAYLVTRDKYINKLEKHVNTYESFEPVKGKAILYVAEQKNLASICAFRLDRPVILKKGTWHGVVAETSQCEIKITENAMVKSVFWKLGFKLDGKLKYPGQI